MKRSRFARWGLKPVGIAGLALLSACGSGPSAAPGPVTALPVAELNQSAYSTEMAQEYRLRAGDVIRVNVFREPDLSMDNVVVAADGSFSMPLVGTVQVRGLTMPQLERELETLLGNRYLRRPEVAINMINYGSHLVTVEGAVDEPGVYPFQPGTRLSGGIALARGLERVARSKDIAVFRQGAEGLEVARFDFAAVQAGTMIDPVIMPGDRIVVGTDSLSQAWQDILQSIPVFALFTRI